MIDDGYKGSPSTADNPLIQAKLAKLVAPTIQKEARTYHEKPVVEKKKRCAQCGRPEGTQHQDRCKEKGMVVL